MIENDAIIIIPNLGIELALLIVLGRIIFINLYEIIFITFLSHEVIKGLKKLLPLHCFGVLNFSYYSKIKKLTKEYIYQKVTNDNNLLSYLPSCKIDKYIKREFLLSLLCYKDMRNSLIYMKNTKI